MSFKARDSLAKEEDVLDKKKLYLQTSPYFLVGFLFTTLNNLKYSL